MRIVLLEKRMMILNCNRIFIRLRLRLLRSSLRPPRLRRFPLCHCLRPRPRSLKILFLYIYTSRRTIPYISCCRSPLLYQYIAHPHTSSHTSILLLLNAFSWSHCSVTQRSRSQIQALSPVHPNVKGDPTKADIRNVRMPPQTLSKGALGRRP